MIEEAEPHPWIPGGGPAFPPADDWVRPISSLAFLGELIPASVWPADHAWCVAADVDPHWAGIGAPDEVIAQLLSVPDLDIVQAESSQPHPFDN